MPVKVIDSVWDLSVRLAESAAPTTIVARGIRYAADNGAKVINMSIGRTGPPTRRRRSRIAIRYAVGKGVFVAIAGGNEFEEGNPTEVHRRDRVAGAGRGVGRGGRSRSRAHAFYSTTGS